MMIFFLRAPKYTFVPNPFTVNVHIIPQKFLTHSMDAFVHTFGKGDQ